MQFQEYQAKELLAQYGIAVPRGEVAASANQAGNAAFRLGGRVAVKAQVLGPGRAAGGGVKLTSSVVEQAVNASKELAVGIDAQESGAVISAKTGEGPVTQVSVDPTTGPTPGQAQQLAGALGLQAEAATALQQLLQNLCRAFRENECRQIHLNPLAVSPQRGVGGVKADGGGE